MNEPPNDSRRLRSAWARLTLQAQVIAALMYLAVVSVLLAAIVGAGAFMAFVIRGAL